MLLHALLVLPLLPLLLVLPLLPLPLVLPLVLPLLPLLLLPKPLAATAAAAADAAYNGNDDGAAARLTHFARPFRDSTRDRPVPKFGRWKMDSIMVFEGDFTNPENKSEMVDVVLGLYAMVLQSQDGMTSELYRLLQSHLMRVFPEDLFHDL